MARAALKQKKKKRTLVVSNESLLNETHLEALND
jgi:hypothetical protein